MNSFSQLVETLVSSGGIRAEQPRRAAPSKDTDAMDVDDEANGDADDESEPLPVKLPRRKRPFKLTSLPVRRSIEENALKVDYTQLAP